jgi:2'-hydroxyisoflavone reductase
VLRNTVEHYLFVSSISAHRQFPPGRHYNEYVPLSEGNEGYGALKARAEEAIEEAMPGRVTVVRPGLIVGPHDPTDRFTYWPRRVVQGGEIVAPGRRSRPVQFVDARDLARWIVQLLEQRRIGVFNAVGPMKTLTMEQLLSACRPNAASDARFTWIDDEALLAFGIQPWTELPLWIPESDESFGGMLMADNRRAISAGLAFRPLEQTVSDTLSWHQLENRNPEAQGRGLPITKQRESALLEAHRGKPT